MSEQSKHKQDEAIASISIQRDDNADGAYVGQVRQKGYQQQVARSTNDSDAANPVEVAISIPLYEQWDGHAWMLIDIDLS